MPPWSGQRCCCRRSARLGVVKRLSSELLGFAPGTRVLIVNCHDFGRHEAIDAAVIESIDNGHRALLQPDSPMPRGSGRDAVAPRTPTQLFRHPPHAHPRLAWAPAGVRSPPRPTWPRCSTPTPTSSASTRRTIAPLSSPRLTPTDVERELRPGRRRGPGRRGWNPLTSFAGVAAPLPELTARPRWDLPRRAGPDQTVVLTPLPTDQLSGRQVQHRLNAPEIAALVERRIGGATVGLLATEYGIHRTTVMRHLQ